MEPSPFPIEGSLALPVVLRARGFRLYTQGGGRLVDLWQSGGRSILGHNPAGLSRELKNCADRGLFSPLPHPQERRLLKALARLMPRRVFRLYADRFSLSRALEGAGFPPTGPFPDPVFGPAPDLPGPSGPSLWRPFLDADVEGPLLIPVLPWPLSPWVLALDPALEDRFAPSAALPPVLLAVAARAVYDLVAAGPQGGRPVYPKINHVLYSAGPSGPWRRRGPYLVYSGAPPVPWETLFRNFLREGFLIPPDPAEPLILPGLLSPGEEAKLAALLR
ncbi:MAG: hypothetical protein LBU00_06100 [Treponema sp.]|jgi:hypothetical protein|nr:hypothetical protein [Treponema sp.]